MKTIVLHIIAPKTNDFSSTLFFNIGFETMKLESFKDYVSEELFHRLTTLSDINIEAFSYCNDETLTRDNCFQINMKNNDRERAFEFFILMIDIFKEKNLLNTNSDFTIKEYEDSELIKDYTLEFKS